jgi:hypothetical protein
MRLLNANTLELEEFVWDLPPYAALSHLWSGGEVSFQDMQNPADRVWQKEGFAKVLACSRLAEYHGLHYFWIDTCCIDKTSSAELSEAINSMFNWYEGASICYVYLPDVEANESGLAFRFEQPRWFT